jgi:hypothetical protein
MTDYKMPPLRRNGNTSTLARPHVFPLPDDTVADEPQPQVTPPAQPEELENETRKGALAKVSDWSRSAIARESRRAAKSRGVWGEHPPSLSMLHQWIKVSDWYCSEAGLKKALAWIDGHLVVMPITALLYGAAWSLHLLVRRGLWHDAPPPLSALLEVSGARRWLLPLVLPITALLYIATWIWQRPLRRLVAAVLATIIHLYL